MADPALTNMDPDPALGASFERLAVALPATVGIAVSRAGQVYSLGRWSSGVAWSTVKVPLAIAALRDDPARAHGLAVKAITESDNAASEQLWSQLGDAPDAARRVQDVIAECGDTETVVQSRRLRKGFTAFGQTVWTLQLQARFAERLSDIPHATPVIDLMRQITSGQRWGLAAKGLTAKGGWGPGPDDGYLVRQFGIVPVETGQWGVALAAEAETFDAGVRAIDALADWLVGRLPGSARR